MNIELKAVTIGKDWQGLVRNGKNTRMNGRMDEKVVRNLMIGLTVEENGEKGKDVLIVRLWQ